MSSTPRSVLHLLRRGLLHRRAPLGRLLVAGLVLAAPAAFSAAPLRAQPVSTTDLEIVGEDTGCAGSSLCGDFGSALASAGDVDGDGVLDLAIGAPTVSSAEPSTGRVYLFFGPFDRDLRAEQADVTVTGLEFGDLVGTPRGGDVDGDGLSDLVIGARGPDVDGGVLNGQVWVFYAPLAGDLSVSDADATITGTSFSELGRAVTVGDFDGDGVDDVLAGASQTLGGRAHLFFGPVAGDLGPEDADATIAGGEAFGELGDAVAAVDLDADGIDDLVVGAPTFPLGDLGAGAVHVFFSPVSGDLTTADADVTIGGEEEGDGFGGHLSSAGDVDGDGFEDLLVGADELFGDGPGLAYLFRGPLAPGELAAADATARFTGEPGDGNDLFGTVAGVGDVNADGFDDVLVGAQFAGAAGLGRAYLFEGPVTGDVGAAEAEWIFDAPGKDPFLGLDVLGRAVGAAGDLDGNGFADFLLGAPGTDGPGFVRVVLAPALALEVTSAGSQVVPPQGGSVDLTFDVTNTADATRSVDLWITVAAPGGGELVRGPFGQALAPVSEVERSVALPVPAGAPAGTYQVTVAVGRFPAAAAADGLSFEKEG